MSYDIGGWDSTVDSVAGDIRGLRWAVYKNSNVIALFESSDHAEVCYAKCKEIEALKGRLAAREADTVRMQLQIDDMLATDAEQLRAALKAIHEMSKPGSPEWEVSSVCFKKVIGKHTTCGSTAKTERYTERCLCPHHQKAPYLKSCLCCGTTVS